MSKQNYEAQFSIYKMDYEKTQVYFLKEKNVELKSIVDAENMIFQDIRETLNKRGEKEEALEENKSGFRGIFFKTYHRPTWNGMANSFIGNINDDKHFISNSHISYVLSYKKEKALYLLTGGLGSNFISEFIQRNFGLYLLPKIIKDDLPAVKTILENKLIGNRLSERRSNRNSTSISDENELATVFRELSLEFGSAIISEFNIIEEGEKIPKLLNVIAKDSLVVRKSLTLDKLANMIEKLYEIEQRKDNFSLGYLVSAKKYGYSSAKLRDLMVDYFKSGKYENFILVGNEISEYYIGATRYLITDSSGGIVMDRVEPVKLKDLYGEFFKSSMSKSRVEDFLRLEVSTYDDMGVKLSPIKLKDCIQGHIENEEGNFFYLFRGDWLIFDPHYVESLDDEFKKQYKTMVDISSSLKGVLTKFGYDSENKYNESYESSSEVILTHKVQMNYIELADLIYYDETEEILYLVHNKDFFDGAGSRDLMNQIVTSAEFINSYRSDSLKRRKFFEDYFNKIKKKYEKNECLKKIEVEEFLKLFNKKICYVAGYLYNLSDCCRSNYAKYLTMDVNKRLKEKNFELKLFDINGK